LVRAWYKRVREKTKSKKPLKRRTQGDRYEGKKGKEVNLSPPANVFIRVRGAKTEGGSLEVPAKNFKLFLETKPPANQEKKEKKPFPFSRRRVSHQRGERAEESRSAVLRGTSQRNSRQWLSGLKKPSLGNLQKTLKFRSVREEIRVKGAWPRPENFFRRSREFVSGESQEKDKDRKAKRGPIIL